MKQVIYSNNETNEISVLFSIKDESGSGGIFRNFLLGHIQKRFGIPRTEAEALLCGKDSEAGAATYTELGKGNAQAVIASYDYTESFLLTEMPGEGIMKVILGETMESLPAAPCASFNMSRVYSAKPLTVFDSKIGGVPYFPKTMEWPRAKEFDEVLDMEGEPLVLLAQFNFEQFPHIQGFPEKGILQFFIIDDGSYGMNENYKAGDFEQKNFRVIFHKDIIRDESMLFSKEDMPYDAYAEHYMPYRKGVFKLAWASAFEMPPAPSDFRFDDVFVPIYNRMTGRDVLRSADIKDEEREELQKLIGDVPAVMLGGYPFFVGDDPRSTKESQKYDTALFSIVSIQNGGDIHPKFSNRGAGTFFISKEALERLDFSDIFYNYSYY